MSEKITLNGKEYVAVDSVESGYNYAEKVDGMEYVIIRADRAGVFAGYLAKEKNGTVELYQARRIWYWDGAASLSQLAVDGVSKPENCKFPVELARIKVLGVIEIIPASEKARLSIKGVSPWQE